MSIRVGQGYEGIAKRFLKAKGLKTIEQNFRTKMGEIDLIMQDKHEIVFVEVKYRKSQKYGGGLAAVTHTKQKRLIRTAQAYLKIKNGFDTIASRFDVVAIEPDGIQWIKNAFWTH